MSFQYITFDVKYLVATSLVTKRQMHPPHSNWRLIAYRIFLDSYLERVFSLDDKYTHHSHILGTFIIEYKQYKKHHLLVIILQKKFKIGTNFFTFF